MFVRLPVVMCLSIRRGLTAAMRCCAALECESPGEPCEWFMQAALACNEEAGICKHIHSDTVEQTVADNTNRQVSREGSQIDARAALLPVVIYSYGCQYCTPMGVSIVFKSTTLTLAIVLWSRRCSYTWVTLGLGRRFTRTSTHGTCCCTGASAGG